MLGPRARIDNRYPDRSKFRPAAWILGLCAVCAWGWRTETPSLGYGQTRDSKPSQEPDYAAELPRIPAKEPAEAGKAIQAKPGFRVEQAAAEPLVNSPVAMDWDEDSRLFVVEMRGYSEHRDEGLSRIRVLTDSDEDGRYDQSAIYADRLFWPTAVLCWDGGIFVADAPDIFYLKDTDGDGRADVKRKVFTGFETSNVQGLLNSFRWTLDNRVHGSASTIGGVIRRVDPPAGSSPPPVSARGRDFSFDPRTLELRAETGGGQHGMSFDDWGRKFLCSNSDHIQQAMAEDRYLARNPYLSIPAAKVSIAPDGPQAEVYRISPIEPWRILRTRLRMQGAVPGVVEGGGRPAGYFTGATGVTICRGDQMPAEWKGMAVVGDVGSNLVHRKRLTLDGSSSSVQYVANRVDEKSEFVASTDIWFRPAQFGNGPDGCLYIADVCREVIEHPASLAPVIKKHLDLDNGRDRGRIYRVVPEGFRQSKLPKLGKATVDELVALLEHPNAWHRETASRLLYQRQDPSAIVPLSRLARESKSPLGRVHALYALDGLRKLTSELVADALRDPSPRVREHAVRLAERVLDADARLAGELVKMIHDPDPQVRYQLAFTIGALPAEAARPAIVAMLKRDGGDRWFRLALFSSLSKGAASTLTDLLQDAAYRRSAGASATLTALAGQAAIEPDAEGVAHVLESINRLAADGDNATARLALLSLSEGLAKSGRSLDQALKTDRAKALFRQVLEAARRVAADPKRPSADRAEALRTLALSGFDESKDVLSSMLDHRQPQETQQAALSALDSFSGEGAAALALNAWPKLSPRLRSAALETLSARPERITALLGAIERGQVQAGEIEAARIEQWRNHRNARVRDQARKLFASVKLARRQDVVDAYSPALKMAGDAARGKALFAKVCAACHRIENVGHEIGPSLAAIKNRGAEAILLNVLDPSREVNPQFVNYVVLTEDGRSLTGLITSETATGVTLKRAEGQSDTVLRIDIEEMKSSGLSLMPEGMEKDIDRQGMADLIAYLMNLP